MKVIEFDSRLDGCLLSAEADLVEVRVNLKGRDGKGAKVESFRLRPVTDGERALARREASTGKQSVSVGRDGTQSYSQELNAEIYNTKLVFFALGGAKIFGTGEQKEGWSLVNPVGEPLPVTVETIRANLHPGIVSKLVEVVIEQNDIKAGPEKN